MRRSIRLMLPLLAALAMFLSGAASSVWADGLRNGWGSGWFMGRDAYIEYDQAELNRLEIRMMGMVQRINFTFNGAGSVGCGDQFNAVAFCAVEWPATKGVVVTVRIQITPRDPIYDSWSWSMSGENGGQTLRGRTSEPVGGEPPLPGGHWADVEQTSLIPGSWGFSDLFDAVSGLIGSPTDGLIAGFFVAVGGFWLAIEIVMMLKKVIFGTVEVMAEPSDEALKGLWGAVDKRHKIAKMQSKDLDSGDLEAKNRARIYMRLQEEDNWREV